VTVPVVAPAEPVVAVAPAEVEPTLEDPVGIAGPATLEGAADVGATVGFDPQVRKA
jgi:hypothetical protein